jgi:hypothetical protein
MTFIRVMLDYVHPWPNAAGFYVARDRGWYREAGLEVELTTHDYGRGDTLAHLSRYEVDFGVFPSNRVPARRVLVGGLPGRVHHHAHGHRVQPGRRRDQGLARQPTPPALRRGPGVTRHSDPSSSQPSNFFGPWSLSHSSRHNSGARAWI